MKKLMILLSFITLATGAVAQSPQAFKYQTIVRDGTGNVVPNHQVSFRMSIHDVTADGTILYRETFSKITDQFGLVNLEIGHGTPVTGSFDEIDWTNGAKFLETEIDPEGGNNYLTMGTSELLSVPYALHSQTVTNADDADADPANELNTAMLLDGTFLKVFDPGGTLETDLSSLINDADADPANELQTLSVIGNDISISNGNTVQLPTEMPSGTTGQTIYHNGSGWIATSNLFNTGTKIGIGTTNPDPSSKLDVRGGCIYINNPGGGADHGVEVENAGGHGFHVLHAGQNGFNVFSTDQNGLNVTHADGDGVHVVEAGNCGIDAEGNNGNHLRSDNTGKYGVYVHSAFSDPGNPGLYVFGYGTLSGDLSAANFSGNGSSLTNLNASNITTGTLSNSRFNALSNLGGGSGTSFLRKDGSWTDPPNTTYTAGDDLILSGTTFSLDNDIDVNYVRATGSNGLGLYDDDNNGIFIANNGNVGIGTNNPDCELELELAYPVNRENTSATFHIKSWWNTEFILDKSSTESDSKIIFKKDGTTQWQLWQDGSENSFKLTRTGVSNALYVNGNGDVGIKTSPAPGYELDVNGEIRCTSLTQTSDERLKTNINDLKNVLGKIERLRAVTFEWNKIAQDNGANSDKKQIGVIAQDLEVLFPELVDNVGGNGYKSVNYSGLAAVLIEAVKELKSENDALKARIEKLENR